MVSSSFKTMSLFCTVWVLYYFFSCQSQSACQTALIKSVQVMWSHTDSVISTGGGPLETQKKEVGHLICLSVSWLWALSLPAVRSIQHKVQDLSKDTCLRLTLIYILNIYRMLWHVWWRIHCSAAIKPPITPIIILYRALQTTSHRTNKAAKS